MEFIFRPQLFTKPKHVRQLTTNLVVCLLNDGFNIILLRWLSLAASWTTILIMKSAVLVVVIYFFQCEGVVVVTREDEGVVNNRPIIGVLSQEQSQYLQTKFPEENYTSYIASSYVKDVEAAGARVVPILIGKDRSYYRQLMEKLNGVLFPGGATYFNQSDGFADAGQHIMDIAKEMNDAGDHFPIFGTCLGFELFIILESGRGKQENRIECSSFDNRPLHFTQDFRDSKMFKNAPGDIISLLENKDITVNSHRFCIVEKNLKDFNLTKDWRVTSQSDDENGIEFIASIEHTRYPFYGVQFHPEKNAFEWKLSKNYPSTAEAIKANRYFMDFFVNECRKSAHKFSNAAEENEYVIYNYVPYFTGVLGSAYHQCYFFEPRGTLHKNNNLFHPPRFEQQKTSNLFDE